MQNVVLHATKVVQKSPFIFVSCDEVITINNQSWLSIYVCVKRMEEGFNSVEVAMCGRWSNFRQFDLPH